MTLSRVILVCVAGIWLLSSSVKGQVISVSAMTNSCERGGSVFVSYEVKALKLGSGEYNVFTISGQLFQYTSLNQCSQFSFGLQVDSCTASDDNDDGIVKCTGSFGGDCTRVFRSKAIAFTDTGLPSNSPQWSSCEEAECETPCEEECFSSPLLPVIESLLPHTAPLQRPHK